MSICEENNKGRSRSTRKSERMNKRESMISQKMTVSRNVYVYIS